MRLIFKGTAYLPEYRGLHDGRMIHVPAGGAVEISDEASEILLKDFPGIFVQDIAAAPVDRQIKEPARRKRL
jgi:hypothetical protein